MLQCPCHIVTVPPICHAQSTTKADREKAGGRTRDITWHFNYLLAIRLVGRTGQWSLPLRPCPDMATDIILVWSRLVGGVGWFRRW